MSDLSPPTCFLRLDAHGHCIECDDAARHMLALTGVGQDVRLLFSGDAQETLDFGLLLRRQTRTEASKYRTTLSLSDGTRRPVYVHLVVEYDDAANVAGYLMFLTDLTMMVAADRMRAVFTTRDSAAVLARCADILRELLPFDQFSVLAVSRSETHVRQMYAQGSNMPADLPRRWFPITPAFKDILLSRSAGVFDLDALVRASGDVATQMWQQYYPRFGLHVPIFQSGRSIGALSISRSHYGPFQQSDIALVHQLPVLEAVVEVLAHELQRLPEFTLHLIRELGTITSDATQLRQILMTRLSDYFGWNQVGVWEVDYARSSARLIHQIGGGISAPALELPIDHGLVGRVLREGGPVVVENIALEPDRIVTDPRVRSAMCIPFADARSVLSVESSELAAFCADELEAVESVLLAVSSLIKTASALQVKSAVLISIADAVFQVSASSGAIVDVNPAALDLLGTASAEEVLGLTLEQFVDAPSAHGVSAANLLAFDYLAPTEIAFVDRNGRRIPVMISGSVISEGLDLKVYVAKDLTTLRRAQQVDDLRRIVGQSVEEMRLPLVMAAAYIYEASRKFHQPTTMATWQGMLEHLRGAELPLERLLELASEPQDSALVVALVDLERIVSSVAREFPEAMQAQILLPTHSSASFALAAPRELAFCVRWTIWTMLQIGTELDRIRIHLEGDGAACTLTLELCASDLSRAERPTSTPNSLPKSDFVNNVLQRMGASFSVRAEPQLTITMRVRAA